MGLNAVSTQNQDNIVQIPDVTLGLQSAVLHLPITEMEFLSYDVN